MEKKDTLSSCSESEEQQMQLIQDKSKESCMDTSSRSGNDAHVDEADIRPIYDEEPKAEVQMTADDNVSLQDNNILSNLNPNNKRRGQQSQFLKEKGNEAKVNNDIDEIETIKIELEHSVAKLLVENELLHKEKEHLKQTYKDLFDSIKTTRVDSEPPNGSNADITNQCEIEQALDVSAWYYRSYRAGLQGHFDPDDSSYGSFCLKKTTSGPISFNVQMTFEHNSSSLGHQCLMMSNNNSSDLAPQRHMASAENNT
ncbi:hypothetical protein Tco_1032794 [Tanacetum coccineum]|uniref:Uncharacterized protein n=1 Tax=Tanacetum coccineum TaxID=301880 RepID=A0ABQ5GFB3_9ASTR